MRYGEATQREGNKIYGKHLWHLHFQFNHYMQHISIVLRDTKKTQTKY